MTRAMRPAAFPWFDYSRYKFSLGVDLGSVAFLSGQAASEYDPREKRIVVRGRLADQTRTAFAKIGAILEAGGYEPSDIVLLVEYLTPRGLDGHHKVEQIRREFLGHGVAVRTVCVNRLVRANALIEIEVVASRSGAANNNPDGLVYLPSCLPLDEKDRLVGEGDVVAQINAVFDRAGRLLAGAGLPLSQIAKTVEYITPAALAAYQLAVPASRERLGPVFPSATAIVMPRLAHPGAMIQLDLVASRNPLEAVNVARESDHSPAVKAGNAIFMSGRALDPATGLAMHRGDVGAQAEHVYTDIIDTLKAAGGEVDDLVKLVEYITPEGFDHYRETGAVRSRLLAQPYPASTGVICERLLSESCIEIEAVAVL